MRPFRLHQANGSDKQDDSEDILDPREALQQTHTGGDEKRPHDDGASDPPEQHTMLLVTAQMQRTKHDEEDKKIVDAQRCFDQVAREELQRMLVAVDPQQPQCEAAREASQNHCPARGEPLRDLLVLVT